MCSSSDVKRTPGTTHPAAWCHIPEDLNAQIWYSSSLTDRTVQVVQCDCEKMVSCKCYRKENERFWTWISLGMGHSHLICTNQLVPQYAIITGVLHLHQEALLKLDFIHGAQFLTRLPDDLAADLLFRSIEAIHMNVGKQRFSEVLAHHIDKCQHEQSWDILQEYLFCEIQSLCLKCCFLQLLEQLCWWCNVKWSTKLMPVKSAPVLHYQLHDCIVIYVYIRTGLCIYREYNLSCPWTLHLSWKHYCIQSLHPSGM